MNDDPMDHSTDSDLIWTPQDSERARKNGWDIFDVDNLGLFEIERVDEETTFSIDPEAVDWVVREAANGYPHAVKALAIHMRDFVEIERRVVHA